MDVPNDFAVYALAGIRFINQFRDIQIFGISGGTENYYVGTMTPRGDGGFDFKCANNFDGVLDYIRVRANPNASPNSETYKVPQIPFKCSAGDIASIYPKFDYPMYNDMLGIQTPKLITKSGNTITWPENMLEALAAAVPVGTEEMKNIRWEIINIGHSLTIVITFDIVLRAEQSQGSESAEVKTYMYGPRIKYKTGDVIAWNKDGSEAPVSLEAGAEIHDPHYLVVKLAG